MTGTRGFKVVPFFVVVALAVSNVPSAVATPLLTFTASEGPSTHSALVEFVPVTRHCIFAVGVEEPCPEAVTRTLPEVAEPFVGADMLALPHPKLEVVEEDRFEPPTATARTECAPFAFGTLTVVDVAVCFASIVFVGVAEPST